MQLSKEDGFLIVNKNYPSVDPKYVDVPLVMVSQREKSYSNTPVDTLGHF